MNSSGRERRRAARARADFPIRITSETGSREGLLKDISAIGLRCTLPDALREMTLVRMGLELPGVPGRATIDGVVVRVEKLRGVSPPTYEMAVYFTGISREARLAIETFTATGTSAADAAK